MLILLCKFRSRSRRCFFLLVIARLRRLYWAGLMVDMACANEWRSFSINKVKVSGSSNNMNRAYYKKSLKYTQTLSLTLPRYVKALRNHKSGKINKYQSSSSFSVDVDCIQRRMVIKVRITRTNTIFIDLSDKVAVVGTKKVERKQNQANKYMCS